ncbi:MAG: SDR family oxidoreductase [Chloroherpetonaceae bacterium]|nr:SDR family oxidoreductase [Chloroherpetonaceae bacterium]MCS7211711.1 SDR family oxidoreductase [Chloroherpetonaceae bacterium]MDW8018649.1 SDR family oxidoreductase [Chloroherpetonaceae bacterium]MDW8465398.1 SDR family oxidoreductase [Chloroherpetonaceae bacterium]
MSFVLITGASTGIGEAFARQYAAKGRPLVLVARSADKLAALANELCRTFQVEVKIFSQDLSLPDAPQHLFDYCQTQRLEIALLINNAGVGLSNDFVHQRLSEIESMMQLNMMSLVKLTHLFLPAMLHRRSGGIINVASVAAFQGTPNMCVYAATKAFVLSFSEALAEELSGTGVRVMALCPGGTATHFFERAGYKQTGFKLPIQSPEAVVRTAIKAFEQGKTVVVTGWLNNLLVFAERFTPRWLNTKLAGAFVGEM